MPSPHTLRAPIWSVARSLIFAVVATCTTASQAWAGGSTDVGVSVNVSQPGFYGQVTIGNTPPPVIYAQPVVIVQPRQKVHPAPLYLRVPPGHEKHWSKHCAQYQACSRPVYFVRYNEHDRDRYNREHDHHHGHDHGDDRGHDDRGHGRHGRD